MVSSSRSPHHPRRSFKERLLVADCIEAVSTSRDASLLDPVVCALLGGWGGMSALTVRVKTSKQRSVRVRECCPSLLSSCPCLLTGSEVPSRSQSMPNPAMCQL